MENELYHVRGHKYLKKILGKNGVYRYIYKLSSEKKAAKYQKLQKEAQDKYDTARNEYDKHMADALMDIRVGAEYRKEFSNAVKNDDPYLADEYYKGYQQRLSDEHDATEKAAKAHVEAKRQAALIEEYYRAGIKARQDYLDFVKDSESLTKASKGKSFVSNLFSKIFKKKK